MRDFSAVTHACKSSWPFDMRDKCCSNFSCLSRLICLILLTQPQLIYAGEFTESQWADCLAVPQPLAAIAARAESKRLIIVTAVSAGYIPATVNWLAFMERLDIRNILLSKSVSKA